MKWIFLIFSFSAFAMKSGDYYQGRKIKGRMKAGANFVLFCEEQTTSCLSEESIEICENRNEQLKRHSKKNLYCAQIKKFKNYDDCRKMQYKMIHQKRDFSSLCKNALKSPGL